MPTALQIAEKVMPFYTDARKMKLQASELARVFIAYEARRFPKGDRKAFWSRPQARNFLHQQECFINLRKR
jgi:hypothetical protein